MSIIPNINNEALQLLPDIALWKQQIADAINYKGGTSFPDEAFTTLAEDIKNIPNFDQYIRLAAVMAGVSATDQLTGQELNRQAGNLTTIIDNLGLFLTLKRDAFYYWNLIEHLEFPVAQLSYQKNYIERTFAECPNLRILRLKSTKKTGVYFISGSNNIELIELGVLERFTSLYSGEKNKLRNIIIGQNSNCSLDLNLWRAKDIIAEGQSGIDELNSNLYNNLLTKLYDYSEDGETRILQIGWLDYITPENIAYANAKGWTITN